MIALRFLVILALLNACSQPRENRLSKSQSPYLRDHADNPVAWHEWNDETLELAKKENKPIIVSIGYSACHWCHVMERESFMDKEVAQIMNENFIAIKVDREQRPEIDSRFVHVSEILTGTAGWPLNAFAVPGGDAFYVVTYLPKDNWKALLLDVSKKWKDQRAEIETQAKAIALNASHLDQALFTTETSGLRYDIPAFLNTIDTWNQQLDFNNGGLRGVMKFPMPSILEFMLQHSSLTNDRQSMQWVTTTLNAMMRGGLYDQLGGGFSRYTVDSLWQVPHFEKMLYDNAQLVSVYAHAYKYTGNEAYKKIVVGTLSFIEREMTSKEGGFYSSINADSEGEEGKFYRWTSEELGDASKYYKVVDGVLNLVQEPPADIKDKLLEARNKRIAPSIDTKMITSWNAMMITGFADAYAATGDQHYLDVALKAAAFLDSNMRKGDRVLRLSDTGGLLDDYAWLAKAYLALYQSTFDIAWINKAKEITDLAVRKFKNEGSPLFYYADNHVTEYFDNVIPSSNSVFSEVLFTLGEYLQDEQYTQLATKAIEQAVASIDIEGVHIANWARLAEAVNFSPYEIAIVGDNAQQVAKQLQQRYLPPAIFLGGADENLPLLENKRVPNKTMIYVCKNRTCKLPVDDPAKALEQID